MFVANQRKSIRWFGQIVRLLVEGGGEYMDKKIIQWSTSIFSHQPKYNNNNNKTQQQQLKKTGIK